MYVASVEHPERLILEGLYVMLDPTKNINWVSSLSPLINQMRIESWFYSCRDHRMQRYYNKGGVSVISRYLLSYRILMNFFVANGCI